MSKDVKEYSPKVISIFDRRQVVCILIGGAYAIPAFIFMHRAGVDITVNISIVTVLLTPPIICGWIKMYGMPFEVFFLKFMLPILFFPKKRVYETKSIFAGIEPEGAQKPGFKNAKRHKMRFKERKEYKELMQKYNSSF